MVLSAGWPLESSGNFKLAEAKTPSQARQVRVSEGKFSHRDDRSNTTNLTGWSWNINEIICVKCLLQCPKQKLSLKKKFLSRDNVEFQFKNVEDIMKMEHHYLTGTIWFCILECNNQRVNVWWETGCLPSLEVFPHDILIHYKGKIVTSAVEESVDPILIKQRKFASPVTRHVNMTYPWSRALRRAYQNFCSADAKKYVSGVSLLGNIGQTQIRGHFAK